MNAIKRIVLAACLSGGYLLVPAGVSAVPMAPAAEAGRVPIAVASASGGARAAELAYAARERTAGDLERFQGGAVLVIGAAALVIVLVVLIVLVLV